MPENVGQFKGQPWVVFDTAASRSFLVGETRPEFRAFGTSEPAISRAGEIIFFSAGRRRAQVPWYTNMDLDGQLSYGMRVWGMYLLFAFPVTPAQFNSEPADASLTQQPTYGSYLAQTIIDFGVLELLLGQEEQMNFPVSRFGAGGGFSMNTSGNLTVPQNSIPQGANVMKFPESIDMTRTNNVNAKIRIAPEVLSFIGSTVAPGVGCPLTAGSYQIDLIEVDGADGTIDLNWAPYSLQCGLIGERIKKTQYGQLAGDQG